MPELQLFQAARVRIRPLLLSDEVANQWGKAAHTQRVGAAGGPATAGPHTILQPPAAVVPGRWAARTNVVEVLHAE